MSLVELLVAMALTAILLMGLDGLAGQAVRVWTVNIERNDLERQAQFALQRITMRVWGTGRLLVPLAENLSTAYSESTRDILAVTMDPTLDLNRDGFADADNDNDGRVDEDTGSDTTKDSAAGIVSIDDDGDGSVDEGGLQNDDDEDGGIDEAPSNNLDSDGDGSLDEDAGSDMNGDAKAGVANKDDDGDGSTDEGSPNDDDEDGSTDEDWFDAVVYYLSNGQIWELAPTLNPSSGLDSSSHVLADHVTGFSVQRFAPKLGERAVFLDISLTLTGDSGQRVTLTTKVQVGGK
jgi:hypothetical protein